jgi:hypothetical protein
MQNNVESFNNLSSYDKYFAYVDSSGNDIRYYSLDFINYDFCFNTLIPNSDIINNASLHQGPGPVPMGNSFDISCLNSVNNCFINKDTSFNIYKRIDASNIRCLMTPFNSNEKIRLKSSPKTGIDPIGSVNIMFATKRSDNSNNIYDLSGENIFRYLDLHIDNDHVIKDGVLQGFPNLGAEREISGTSITNTATGGSFSMGDFNFPSLFGLGGSGGLTAEQYAYMLETGTGNRHPYLNNYNAPFYSSFEAAMNNPSNPLVNPLNSMNPQQYSDSLFGPNISPHMVQNMCKNSKLNSNSKVEESGEKDSNKESNKESNKDSKNNSVGSSGNPMNDIFNKINATSNSMLTQNSNESSSLSSSNTSNNTINNNGSEVPPCPPCARCPQSDFECKKVPNYEQGLENSSLPRAVLSDFSTFGM